MGCVYLARCKVNGKGYVGKTIRTIEDRKFDHDRCVREGSIFAFHCAIRKHGWDAFEWSILTEDDDADFLNFMEQKWIKRLGTKVPNGYNMTDGGDGQSVGWKHSEESKKAIGIKQKGKPKSEEHKKKMSLARKGIKQTPEQVKKNSECHKGIIPSEETRKKLSATSRGRKHTEETKEKIRSALTGKERSEEHCLHLSQSLKGKPAWNKGVYGVIKASEETKQKMRESHRKRREVGHTFPPAPAAPGAPKTPPEPGLASPENAGEGEEGETPPTEEEAVKTAARALDRAVQTLGLDLAGAGLPSAAADWLIEKAAGR